MDSTVRDEYQRQIDAGERCRAWLNLETTVEFLRPLREKVASLKNIDFETIQGYEDRTFRSKVEARFLAAKEIEDYLSLLDDTVGGIEQALEALEGKNVEVY